jgi:hypothetical protein
LLNGAGTRAANKSHRAPWPPLARPLVPRGGESGTGALRDEMVGLRLFLAGEARHAAIPSPVVYLPGGACPHPAGARARNASGWASGDAQKKAHRPRLARFLPQTFKRLDRLFCRPAPRSGHLVVQPSWLQVGGTLTPQWGEKPGLPRFSSPFLQRHHWLRLAHANISSSSASRSR